MVQKLVKILGAGVHGGKPSGQSIRTALLKEMLEHTFGVGSPNTYFNADDTGPTILITGNVTAKTLFSDLAAARRAIEKGGVRLSVRLKYL